MPAGVGNGEYCDATILATTGLIAERKTAFDERGHGKILSGRQ